MNWFERHVIANISPRWAANRARARRIFNEYEAIAPSRLRKNRIDTRSANAQTEISAEKIRTMARSLDQNLDIAKGALNTLCANIVGTGIIPEPLIELKDGGPAEEVNRELLRLWDDWIDRPEVTGCFDYYALQRMLCRSWLRDGEVFAQRITGTVPGLNHGTLVPYSLEALEADFIPLHLTDRPNNLIQGIKINAWGAPVAYTVYKTHPGDNGAINQDTKVVAADRITHIKFVDRLHQLRGISVFASVLARLDDIKEIDESERVAARVASAMAAYIKKGSPSEYELTNLGSDGKPEMRSMDLVPGMIFDDLLPGEEIGTIDTKRPNNALIPFRDSQLKSAAAGLGAGYSSISKNYDGTYSAQRQELVEQFVHYRTVTNAFISGFCKPVWYGFIDAALASGAIKLSDVNPATVYNATHAPPPIPWIDPEKEVNAAILAQEQGYKSRSRIIRERGDNPDQVNREIQRDQAEVERLGLKLGKPAPDPNAAAPAAEPAPPPEPAKKKKQPDPAAAKAEPVVVNVNVPEQKWNKEKLTPFRGPDGRTEYVIKERIQ